MPDDANLTERNLELSAEFSRFVFEHPEIEAKISVESEIILLPEFDPELKEHNRRLGKTIEAEGGKVIYFSIRSIRPKYFSRIEPVELASVA